MKRSLDAMASEAEKSAPKTSDNSTSTGTHMKKFRKVGTRAKHQLRRGASHASSAQEYMKSEWTCDELDLSKEIAPITDFADDPFKLVEELFSIFSVMEVKAFTPEVLKDYSVNQLKELCVDEILESISTTKLKFMCEGNRPEDFVAPQIKETGAPIDDIQLSVDDNEYTDFLGSENLIEKKPTKEMKDASVQANEVSLESSSDDEVNDGEGWKNLFARTQMEILELEMRARAIRMLLKAQEEEEGTQMATDYTKPTDESNNNKDFCVDRENSVSKEDNENENKNIVNEDSNSVDIEEEKANPEDIVVDDMESVAQHIEDNHKEDSEECETEANVADNEEHTEEVDPNDNAVDSNADTEGDIREVDELDIRVEENEFSEEEVNEDNEENEDFCDKFKDSEELSENSNEDNREDIDCEESDENCIVSDSVKCDDRNSDIDNESDEEPNAEDRRQ